MTNFIKYCMFDRWSAAGLVFVVCFAGSAFAQQKWTRTFGGTSYDAG